MSFRITLTIVQRMFGFVLTGLVILTSIIFLNGCSSSPIADAKYGDTKNLRIFVRTGKNINKTYPLNETRLYGGAPTILFTASAWRQEETVAMLIQEGADPSDPANDGVLSSTVRNMGYNGLESKWRNERSYRNIVEALVVNGAEIEAGSKVRGRSATALRHATENEDYWLVNYLLDKGANPNNNVYDKTPLMIAAELENIDIIKALIGYGANVEKQDRMGRTAKDYLALAKARKSAEKDNESDGPSLGKILTLGAVAGLAASAGISAEQSLEVLSSTASDLYSDNGGASNLLQLLEKNKLPTEKLKNEENSQQASKNKDPIEESYSFVCSGTKQKNTVPLAFYTQSCRSAMMEFAKSYGCNEIDKFDSVKNNCLDACGDPQCLERP